MPLLFSQGLVKCICAHVHLSCLFVRVRVRAMFLLAGWHFCNASFASFLGTYCKTTADQLLLKSSNMDGKWRCSHKTDHFKNLQLILRFVCLFCVMFVFEFFALTNLSFVLTQSVINFDLSSDYSASGIGLPGRSPQLVSFRYSSCSVKWRKWAALRC